MAKQQKIRASCLCGDSKYEVSIANDKLPLAAMLCHCDTCRHVSGALCATYAKLPPGIKPPETVFTSLQAYETSDSITRYFCNRCGSHLVAKFHAVDIWAVATGSLTIADGTVQFVRHVFIEDTIDGGFSDWLPEIQGQALDRWAARPTDKQLEPGWSISNTSSNLLGAKRLHAHCACKGVNIYISRPSAKSEETSGPWPDVLVPYYEERPTSKAPWWLAANKTKYLAGVCSCDSCRLGAGFEFQEWAFVPVSDISLSEDGQQPFSRQFGTLASYRSSDTATRRFCATCGATVFWDGDSRPGLIDVSVGLLAAAEGARAESWIEFSTKRLSYREDSIKRAKAITEALEMGLKQWQSEDIVSNRG